MHNSTKYQGSATVFLVKDGSFYRDFICRFQGTHNAGTNFLGPVITQDDFSDSTKIILIESILISAVRRQALIEFAKVIFNESDEEKLFADFLEPLRKLGERLHDTENESRILAEAELTAYRAIFFPELNWQNNDEYQQRQELLKYLKAAILHAATRSPAEKKHQLDLCQFAVSLTDISKETSLPKSVTRLFGTNKRPTESPQVEAKKKKKKVKKQDSAEGHHDIFTTVYQANVNIATLVEQLGKINKKKNNNKGKTKLLKFIVDQHITPHGYQGRKQLGDSLVRSLRIVKHKNKFKGYFIDALKALNIYFVRDDQARQLVSMVAALINTNETLSSDNMKEVIDAWQKQLVSTIKNGEFANAAATKGRRRSDSVMTASSEPAVKTTNRRVETQDDVKISPRRSSGDAKRAAFGQNGRALSSMRLSVQDVVVEKDSPFGLNIAKRPSGSPVHVDQPPDPNRHRIVQSQLVLEADRDIIKRPK